MTSASSSEARRRNLAVYQVPPPPGGWEGHDLVRIVDALGVGAAWLDARRFGSVAALHLRADPTDEWTSFTDDRVRHIVAIDVEDLSSRLRQRDPVSAGFIATDGGLTSDLWFEDGALIIETSAVVDLRASLGMSLHIHEQLTMGQRRIVLALPCPTSSREGGTVRRASL